MNWQRMFSPKTNPALYTALASIALSVWQAVQVDFWRGSLTLPEVGRVAAPIVIAALVAWQRGKTTPLADPRDGNGNPLHGPMAGPVPPAQPPAGRVVEGQYLGDRTPSTRLEPPAQPPASTS